MTTVHNRSATRINGFAWVGIITVSMLMIPLITMQFTDEVNWNFGDFIIMGVMLFGVGSIFVYISRKVALKPRLVVGVILAFLFLWLWAELAVGVITDWGN